MHAAASSLFFLVILVHEFENLFDRAPEDVGDVHGEAEGGVVFAALQRGNRLAPDADHLGELGLLEMMLHAQLVNAGFQHQRSPSLSIWRKEMAIAMFPVPMHKDVTASIGKFTMPQSSISSKIMSVKITTR